MKKENGYTGVDIAISVVVITIFIALIGTLVFNFNSSSNEMEYKSKALNYAINEIEGLKGLDINSGKLVTTPETQIEPGYYKSIQVVDATDADIMSDSDLAGRQKVENLVKKVTVTVSYNFRNQTKSVELSTIVTANF